MGLFSKKHYEEVAKILRSESERPLSSLATVDDIFDKFARRFENDNPKFDYSKFYKATWGDHL